jgi:predicted DsbA family dithiol-disulfide isomerase
MKGYSRSKEDYLDLLIKKYKMKEAIFIEWESCSKCHMMKPHVEERAEKSWYEFQTFRFDDASVKEFDVQAVPMLVIREDWIVKDLLQEDGIVNLISNQ